MYFTNSESLRIADCKYPAGLLQANSWTKEAVRNHGQTGQQRDDPHRFQPRHERKAGDHQKNPISFPPSHLSSPNAELQNIAAILALAIRDQSVQFTDRTNDKRHSFPPIVLSISEPVQLRLE